MKKYKNDNKKYIQIRIKENTGFSHEGILSKFNVDCDFLKVTDGSNPIVTIGFNTDLQEKLITDFINQGYDLISVSEDEKSITFHLIYEE